MPLLVPLAILLSRGIGIAFIWYGFWNSKQKTYEGAILNAINAAYKNYDEKLGASWYEARGLSEGQVLAIIGKIRFLVVNKILPFPEKPDQFLKMQIAISNELNFPIDSRLYKAVYIVLAAVSQRIKPETETATTSRGTLYSYIRGGVTKADQLNNFTQKMIDDTQEGFGKLVEIIPWYLKPGNLLIIAGAGAGIYLFGPAIRRRLK